LKPVFKTAALEVFRESFATIKVLFKILIPALVLVKILEHFGATTVLAEFTQPLMQPLGLPDIAGIIWATAMLVNIYAAIAVFFSVAATFEWTQAQATGLAILMLTTHNLVVELRIAQKAGCRVVTQLLLRLGAAILFCYLLHLLFSITGWLQQDANFIWQPQVLDESLSHWLIVQTQNLATIAVIIFILIALLRVFKAIGIEKLLVIGLKPLFQFIGMAKEATNITVIGFTIGLAYGGGLLIREAQSGRIDKQNIFASISLLGICHSLIEDTLLVLIIGADFYSVVFIRLFLSIMVIAALVRSTRRLSPSMVDKFLIKSSASG